MAALEPGKSQTGAGALKGHTMSAIPEGYLDILQSTALAHVATIGPKGSPQVSPIWFAWDGTHVLFALNKIRQKFRNIQREPRIAISIVDPTNPYRSLEIRGSATRIDADLGYRYLNLLSQKYLGRDAGPEEAGLEEERVVIFVEPQQVVLFPPQGDHK
jgi:PPOX class probable F420-dependent enzyme